MDFTRNERLAQIIQEFNFTDFPAINQAFGCLTVTWKMDGAFIENKWIFTQHKLNVRKSHILTKIFNCRIQRASFSLSCRGLLALSMYLKY